MGLTQQSCARVSDWPISIHDWVYIFPSVEFSVVVLTFYTLKSVTRKASVYSKCLFFQSHSMYNLLNLSIYKITTIEAIWNLFLEQTFIVLA